MGVATNPQVTGLHAPARGTTTDMNALSGLYDGQEFWNTTYKHLFRWINNRWWPIGAPDPRYGFLYQDEFHRAVGVPWTALGTVNNGAGASGMFGSWNITHSTASNRSGITQTFETMLLGSYDLYFEAIIKVGTLATVSEDYVLTAGFSDQLNYEANGLATDGVYFQYDRAVTGDFWGTRTASNSTRTSNTSTIAVAANTTYRLGIVISGSTSAKFYVNGTQTAATHSANLPTGAGRQTAVTFRVDKTAGSAASAFEVDHMSIYGFFASARVS